MIFLLKTTFIERYSNPHTHLAAPPNRLVNDNNNEEQPYRDTKTLTNVNIILGFLKHLKIVPQGGSVWCTATTSFKHTCSRVRSQTLGSHFTRPVIEL